MQVTYLDPTCNTPLCVAVCPQKYWSVPMRGVSIGGAPVATNASYAILDSGTRLIIASDADAQAINAVRPLQKT